MAGSEEAVELLRRQSQMEARRAPYLARWQEIAERILPRQAEFFGAPAQGKKRTNKIFDSTAQRALPKFAAILESILIPRNQTWHRVGLPESLGMKNTPAAKWFDALNSLLWGERYSVKANFATTAHESLIGLGAFGTLAIFTDSTPDSVLGYKNCHLGEVCFAVDAWGRIDTAHRQFRMTARQIIQKFDPARVPQRVHEAAKVRPHEEMDLLHCTFPNPKRVDGAEDAAGMKHRSVYVLKGESAVVMEGGYASWPWAISRYVTAPSEMWGRSPADDALADVNTLNEAAKARLKGWHYAADPVLLVQNDGVLSGKNFRPGALVTGGLDSQGRELVRPMTNGANVAIDQAMQRDVVAAVEDPFLIRLFLLAIENPNMTAREVLERVKQQGILLAPQAGRQQTEFLGPLIEREIDLLGRAGKLPELPPDLVELIVDGRGAYTIEYISPLADAARAEEGISVMRHFEQISGIAKGGKPEILDRFDADAAYDVLARSNSLPAVCNLDDKTVEAIRQQRAQQQAMQAAMAAGPALGQTVAGLSRGGA